MDENKNDEKLLSGPKPEKFLPPAENFPLLNAEEFLKRTPPHELKNIFGRTGNEEILKPPAPIAPPVFQNEKPAPEPGNVEEELSYLTEKDDAETEMPAAEPKPKVKPKRKIGWRSVARFLLGLLLFIIIIVTLLYVWGGTLK